MDPSTVAISALEHQLGSVSEPRILPRDIPTMEGRIRWLLKAIEDGVSVSISEGIEASPASEFLHTTKVALEHEKRQPDIAALLLEFNELPAEVFDLRGASLTIEFGSSEEDIYEWLTGKPYRPRRRREQ